MREVPTKEITEISIEATDSAKYHSFEFLFKMEASDLLKLSWSEQMKLGLSIPKVKVRKANTLEDTDQDSFEPQEEILEFDDELIVIRSTSISIFIMFCFFLTDHK